MYNMIGNNLQNYIRFTFCCENFTAAEYEPFDDGYWATWCPGYGWDIIPSNVLKKRIRNFLGCHKGYYIIAETTEGEEDVFLSQRRRMSK